jgi:putative membrane protein
MQSMMSRRELIVLLALTSAAVLVSGYKPYDGLTWVLEVGPVLVGVPLLFATYRPFPLTRLLYYLLFMHGLILILGGHYTYARVPVGFWVQDWFDLARNHYDRLGHVAQGFVPAILAREILIRLSSSNGGRRSSWGRAPILSSGPKATSGIRSGTCFWRYAEPLARS